MKVSKALEAMKKLVKDGYGDLPLIATCTSSGVSSDVSLYDSTEIVEGGEDGVLCDMEQGTKYVPIYLG